MEIRISTKQLEQLKSTYRTKYVDNSELYKGPKICKGVNQNLNKYKIIDLIGWYGELTRENKGIFRKFPGFIRGIFLQNIAKDSHAHQRALSSFRIQSGIGAFRDILRFRHANFPLRIFLYSYIHEFVKRISVRQLPLSLPFSSRIRYVKTFQERRFSFKRLFVSPAMKAFSKRFRSR